MGNFLNEFVDFLKKIWAVIASVTRKKLPNVYKSCPKLISLENDRFLTLLQKLPKNVGNLGKSCPKSNKSPNLVTLPTSSILA